MKLIKTKDAVGQVICHDMTQIIKGVKKGPAFKKGHIITEEDIPVLLSIGKDQIYIWEKQEGILHENEAAEILASLCKSDHMEQSAPSEGKIELKSTANGLLKVNREGLKAVNSFGQMMIASRHGNTVVNTGDKICGTRIIPLVIEEEKMLKAKEACLKATGGKPIFEIKPFVHHKVGIITTGNEVYYGRIQDTFTPVIEEKIKEFNFDTELVDHQTWNDDNQKVTQAILDMIENKDASLVICTGGMSVDPDDKTPLSIKNTGARVLSYGSPVLPGAMFMLAYYTKKDGNTATIMGLPGCAMYHKRTVVDLVLPRVMANDEVTNEELAGLGEGGLCLNCKLCTFPNCGFGKGH